MLAFTLMGKPSWSLLYSHSVTSDDGRSQCSSSCSYTCCTGTITTGGDRCGGGGGRELLQTWFGTDIVKYIITHDQLQFLYVYRIRACLTLHSIAKVIVIKLVIINYCSSIFYYIILQN